MRFCKVSTEGKDPMILSEVFLGLVRKIIVNIRSLVAPNKSFLRRNLDLDEEGSRVGSTWTGKIKFWCSISLLVSFSGPNH